jgi:hypothetical protein
MSDGKKVVPMFPGAVPSGAPLEANPNVVKALEECLEQAKSGQIVGVVIAKRMHDSVGEYSFAGYLGMTGIGALTAAATRMALLEEL